MTKQEYDRFIKAGKQARETIRNFSRLINKKSNKNYGKITSLKNKSEAQIWL